jgi:hypothetical protein
MGTRVVQCSVHGLELQAGGYVSIGGRLGQIHAVELSRAEGGELTAVVSADLTGPADVRIALARGHGIVLEGGVRPFHDLPIERADGATIAAWLERVRPQGPARPRPARDDSRLPPEAQEAARNGACARPVLGASAASCAECSRGAYGVRTPLLIEGFSARCMWWCMWFASVPVRAPPGRCITPIHARLFSFTPQSPLTLPAPGEGTRT